MRLSFVYIQQYNWHENSLFRIIYHNCVFHSNSEKLGQQGQNTAILQDKICLAAIGQSVFKEWKTAWVVKELSFPSTTAKTKKPKLCFPTKIDQ